MPESIMVLAIKRGQNSKPNKKEIIMKKDYGRLGLPNLLETSATKTAAPIVDKEELIVSAEPIADTVEPIVNKEEPKSKKKTKEEQPQNEVTEAPAE